MGYQGSGKTIVRPKPLPWRVVMRFSSETSYRRSWIRMGEAALRSFLIGMLEGVFAKCQNVDVSAETLFSENLDSLSKGSG
jgi:hypothetical protein